MQYVIRQTRNFYGPSETRSLVAHGDGRAETFETRRAALARIAEFNSGRYVTSHNESSRPGYAVINVNRLPAYLRAQV